ncbi:MAG: RNA methyltransferase [Sphingobacteriales bacterium]|nr:MAG: RNA methyltransferase [Sphingobacteriales bacterium]
MINRHPEAAVFTVSEEVLASVSGLKTPNSCLIVVPLPDEQLPAATTGWVLALESIRDPGNLGTLIRIADWFGIRQIVGTPDCVDIYNPKVVQAAMGGHLRMQFHFTELEPYLKTLSVPILAAALDGMNMYEMQPVSSGVLIIGNESRGISPGLLRMASEKVTIPRLGGAESLNAAVAAGILCAHFIR